MASKSAVKGTLVQENCSSLCCSFEHRTPFLKVQSKQRHQIQPTIRYSAANCVQLSRRQAISLSLLASAISAQLNTALAAGEESTFVRVHGSTASFSQVLHVLKPVVLRALQIWRSHSSSRHTPVRSKATNSRYHLTGRRLISQVCDADSPGSPLYCT